MAHSWGFRSRGSMVGLHRRPELAQVVSTCRQCSGLGKEDRRPAPTNTSVAPAQGVDPPYQGQSIGGMLIQPVLARADAEGLPCYLETENPRNVPFYQKHGFKVMSEDEVTNCRLHVWSMLREPRR